MAGNSEAPTVRSVITPASPGSVREPLIPFEDDQAIEAVIVAVQPSVALPLSASISLLVPSPNTLSAP